MISCFDIDEDKKARSHIPPTLSDHHHLHTPSLILLDKPWLQFFFPGLVFAATLDSDFFFNPLLQLSVILKTDL